MPVVLPTEFLFVPSISFRESGPGKTTILTLFSPLRPSTAAPRPQHGYQLVNGVLDSDEDVQLQQRPFAGGDGATEATIQKIVKGSTFVAGTQNVTRFPMTVNSKADVIYLVAITPESANASAVTAKEKEIFADGLAGDAPDSAADGFVFSAQNASRAAIATAMQTYFGTDPDVAVTITDTDQTEDTLNYAAGAVGANGNFQVIMAEILPGAPDLDITFGANFEPIITNIGKGWGLGAHKDFNDNNTPNVLDVTSDTTLYDFGSALVGLKNEGTFILRQRDNPEIFTLLTNTARSYGASRTFAMPGGDQGLPRFSLVAVHPSSKVKGQVDFDVVYEAQFRGGLLRNFAKEAEPAIQVTYTGIAADEGAPVGFSGFFRQFAA